MQDGGTQATDLPDQQPTQKFHVKPSERKHIMTATLKQDSANAAAHVALLTFALAPVTTVTVSRAITIARTLGTRRAAGYCRNNGLPLVVALYWLSGSDAASRCLYGD
jgi:hypothetical protein